MAKDGPSWSPWGQKRKQNDELLKSFGRQCRLHMEAELQHMIAVEREKVLCDLAVHAQFINQWLDAAYAQLREGPQYESQAPQSADCFLLPQDQQVPDSYIARLLHGTTLQQVQQVLHMTPQEWAQEMTSWFAESSMQIEFLTRPVQEAPAQSAKSTQVSCSPAADSAQMTLQQQQLSREGGSFGSAGTACRVSSAPAAWGAPTAAAPGTHSGSQAALQQVQDAVFFSCQGTPSCVSGAAHGAQSAAACGACSPVLLGTATAEASGAKPAAAFCLWPCAAHGAPIAAAPKVSEPFPLQRSGSSGSWSLQRGPINVAPAHVRQALESVVDRGIHMCTISTVLGHFVHMAGEGILTGGKLDTYLDHSQAITDRLQLTELQELHLYICMEELERMNSSVEEQGSQLLQLAAQPTLQLAAAAAHSSATQSNPKQRQQRHSHVLPEPLDLMESLESQLLRVSDRLHRNMTSVFLFLVNTLTRQQLAVLNIACYPRIASTFTVAHVVHKRVQQQQQALLAAVERSARQTGAIPAALAEHPHAGLFAACGLRSSSAAAHGQGSKSAADSSMQVAQYNLHEHEQQRMAQLLHHQKLCWEQLGCQPMH